MRKIFILFIFIFSNNLLIAKSAVTYDFSGGRFGDNLLAYLHAKWISYKNNIPLLYKPFEYSNNLVMHQKEFHLNSGNNFRSQKKISKFSQHVDAEANCLYIVPYFSEIAHEYTLPWAKDLLYFNVQWNNSEFKQIIQEMVAPIDYELQKHELPKNKITVALHVRKGGGFDGPLLSETTKPISDLSKYPDYHMLVKFPPDFFYIDQIKVISKVFGHQPIYLYVFTDHQDPATLVEKFKHYLSEYDKIEFDYRKRGNHHESNILEDFFALTKFDCLIRSESNFSICAAKIANYAVEIFPTSCHWEGTTPYIDKTEMIINHELLNELLNKYR